MKALRERLDDLGEEYGHTFKILDPSYLDSAVIGITPSPEPNPEAEWAAVLVYSYEKLLDAHTANGMSYEEAVEWVEYNTLPALQYMHPGAPIVIYDLDYYNISSHNNGVF